MLNLRPVWVVVGCVLAVMAAAMLPAVAVSLTYHDRLEPVFLASAGLTLVCGLLLVLTFHSGGWPRLAPRQLLLAIGASWVAAWLVAALPLSRALPHLSLVDSLFEAASGVTASAATVLGRPELLPHSVVMLRATLQWLGGVGALFTGLAVLPALNIGGMAVFRLDGTEAGASGMPRSARTLGGIILVYFGLTLILALLLWLAGMGRFAALIHAMGALSCGGYSTVSGTLGVRTTPIMQWLLFLGMALGGAPFVVHLQIVRGRWRQALRNRELTAYGAVLSCAIVVLGLWLWLHERLEPEAALRHGVFTATSILTGTGFASLDYGSWQGLPVVLLLALSCIGGCTGSTAGGIKIFRLRVMASHLRAQLIRLLRPHAVMRATPEPLAEAVAAFLFLYALAFAATALALTLAGFDVLSALTTAASALADLGPGFTQAVGPLAGFSATSDAAKLVLIAAMLFGRVEMLSALVLFLPSFWRR